MSCELIIGVDNPIYLSGLKDEFGFVNEATVTITISDGIEAGEEMVYETDSDGVYKYTLDSGAALVDGDQYEITMEAVWLRDGDGKTTTIRATYVARSNQASYGPDVYASCKDLLAVFGRDNIEKWADLDNEEDEEVIRDRMEWALHLASRRIDDRLRGGPYTVPFTLPYPHSLKDMTSRLAGVILYEGPRGMADAEDGVSLLGRQKDEVEAWLSHCLDGRVRLRVSSSARSPGVVKECAPRYTTLAPGTYISAVGGLPPYTE